MARTEEAPPEQIEEFSWKSPNYGPIFQKRVRMLQQIRANPAILPHLRLHYRLNPIQFIQDWGMTYDPRNVTEGEGGWVPFILFPKQRELVTWLTDHWQNKRPGLVEKTRDMGLSWVTISLSCHNCIFNKGMAIGFGSKKEDDVDKNGDLGSLFEKGRLFMEKLPVEFRAGYSKATSPHKLITFPETGSFMFGDSGDAIGRGKRSSYYVVDESAFLERPHLADAALAGTTDCRFDISTPNGMANSFAEKRFSGSTDVFSFHWKDDPRRDDEWYAKKCSELDPVTIAREFDINYSASIEGVLIPPAWVNAAIDSHTKLGIANSGARLAALDVADEGKDKCALAGSYGFLLEHLEEFSGKNSDILQTVIKAFAFCDQHRYTGFCYDADGLGAGVRGDARHLNEIRKAAPLEVTPFRGSGAVIHPMRKEEGRSQANRDFFSNYKAQSWWHIRTRFQKTYRAVIEGEPIDHEDLISISSAIPNLSRLIVELSQPTYKINQLGKIVINKMPDGQKSPNLADAVMMRFAPSVQPIRITSNVTARFATPRLNTPRFNGPSQATSARVQRFQRR